MASTSGVHGAAGEVLQSVNTITNETLQYLGLKSQPSHALAISQLEQSMPRGWSRPVFFFALSKDVDPMTAVETLRKGLEPTKKAIPSLASEIVPDDKSVPSGGIALRPGNFGSLVVKDLRGTGLLYEELQQQNFPQSRLDPDLLCATGIFPAPKDQQPVFVPQVNIIDGGLILSLSIHHAIFDAQAINEVLRVWAQNCHHLHDEAIYECSSLPSEIFDKVAHYSSHEPTSERGRPEHHPEVLITPEPVTFGETAFIETHRSRVYRLPPKALAELKNDCTEPETPWISTNDAATALIWRSIIRSQLDPAQFDESTVSHHIVNVDLRLRSHPPLLKNHIGCPMSYARPGINIRELVDNPNIAPVARAIRAGVEERNPDYVDSLVTLLNTIPGYDHWISASYPNLMGTDVLTSTWYKLDIYDLNWGPTLGRIERLRFTLRGLFNGLNIIYPQVTRPAGQEGMEIAIGLDEANFKRLEADSLWSKYADSADPGYDQTV